MSKRDGHSQNADKSSNISTKKGRKAEWLVRRRREEGGEEGGGVEWSGVAWGEGRRYIPRWRNKKRHNISRWQKKQSHAQNDEEVQILHKIW